MHWAEHQLTSSAGRCMALKLRSGARSAVYMLAWSMHASVWFSPTHLANIMQACCKGKNIYVLKKP